MRVWKQLLERVNRTEDGLSLVLFRIGIGVSTLALTSGALVRGVHRIVWVDAEGGGYRHLNPDHPLLRLLGGATVEVATGLALATSVAALLVALGLFTRAAALVALLALNLIVHINGDVASGYDRLLANGLWLLVLARSSTLLSLHAWWRGRRGLAVDHVSAWPRYLAVYQLTLVYLVAGLNKIGAAWTPAGGFSALYYILMQPDWQRSDMSWLAHVYPLTQAATAMTWAWELTFPAVLIWLMHRRRGGSGEARFRDKVDLRLPWLGLGLVMHLLTWASMEVGPFSWATLSYYVCFFHPAEIQGAVSRWRCWLSTLQRALRRPGDRGDRRLGSGG